MIQAKGSHVHLQMVTDSNGRPIPVRRDEDGRIIPYIMSVPQTYGLLHDPDGEALTKCEVYVGPYQTISSRAQMSETAKRYFGTSDRRQPIRVTIPAGPWRFEGDAVQIFYQRPAGRRRAIFMGRYFHPFNRIIRVYRCGQFAFLDMPRGCIINERGFVSP